MHFLLSTADQILLSGTRRGNFRIHHPGNTVGMVKITDLVQESFRLSLPFYGALGWLKGARV